MLLMLLKKRENKRKGNSAELCVKIGEQKARTTAGYGIAQL